MKRRDFLEAVNGVAATAMVPAPATVSAARADARSETLLVVSEGGPNNLGIHGIGTNVPGYEVSWNCCDRLITHGMKAGPGGVPYHDRDKPSRSKNDPSPGRDVVRSPFSHSATQVHRRERGEGRSSC